MLQQVNTYHETPILSELEDFIVDVNCVSDDSFIDFLHQFVECYESSSTTDSGRAVDNHIGWF